MEKKEINLIKLYLLKERVHWKRIKIGFMIFNNWFAKILGGGLLTLGITLFHYIFSIPHFIFECIMYYLNRHQFKLNMVNLHNDATKKMVEYKIREERIIKSR
jgi:hypothetical protein